MACSALVALGSHSLNSAISVNFRVRQNPRGLSKRYYHRVEGDTCVLCSRPALIPATSVLKKVKGLKKLGELGDLSQTEMRQRRNLRPV